MTSHSSQNTIEEKYEAYYIGIRVGEKYYKVMTNPKNVIACWIHNFLVENIDDKEKVSKIERGPVFRLLLSTLQVRLATMVIETGHSLHEADKVRETYRMTREVYGNDS